MKRKLLESRSILGPLLGEVLGSCKSGTGGTGRSNCHELLSSLLGSEGAAEIAGSPNTCLSVRGPKGLALDSQGMSGLVGVAWATALQGMSRWPKSYRGSGSVHISFFFFSLSFEN